jgi:hypothetical protein
MGKEVCFVFCFFVFFTFAFDTELIAGTLGSGQLMELGGLQAFSEDTKDLIFFSCSTLPGFRVGCTCVHGVCYDSMEIGKWLVWRLATEPSNARQAGRQDEMGWMASMMHAWPSLA